MLRSSNLTVAVPYFGCNKNCPYCISKMTGNYNNNFIEDKNDYLFMLNFEKMKNIAKQSGVGSVLITGKGEPLVDGSFDYTLFVLNEFQNFITEIQTNGIEIINGNKLNNLINYKVSTVSISIDNTNDLLGMRGYIRKLKRNGVVVRITLNLSDILYQYDRVNNRLTSNFLDDLHIMCSSLEIDQFTFRKLSIPYGHELKNPAHWIYEYANPRKYDKLLKKINKIVKNRGVHIRTLNHGVSVYDYHNIGVSISNYCIQEDHTDDNLRSLIYMQDGHLYTHWGRKASILM